MNARQSIRLALCQGLATIALSSAGYAEEAQKPLPPVEFSGYWRLGYNTDINPLQGNRSDQGTSVQSSRHIHNSSYLNLGLAKTLENGTRAAIVVDHSGATPHKDGSWDPVEPALLTKRDFRIRDLYVELPAGGAKIWAGARRFEWEDIRILDYGNPFNVNGYGVGTSFSGTSVSLTVAERSIGYKVGEGTAAIESTVPLKDLTLLARHELSLGENRAIKPMLVVTQHGTAPKNEELAQPKIKGSTAFKIGGVYSSWSDSHWANMGMWFESVPVDQNGSVSGTNTAVGLMASNSYEFDTFGVLTGLLFNYQSFKNSQQEFKIADDKTTLEPDSDKTTNNRMNASLAVQPVYYATDHLHLALDLNYTLTTKKFAKLENINGVDRFKSSDANAFYATPIVRYAMAKNTIGTPQIYTSFTYGKYDWKLKTDSKGKPTDTLLTTQTGFEVWF